MSWTLTDDLDAFSASAGPLLRARPIENTVPLSVVATLRENPATYDEALFGWWRLGGGAGDEHPVRGAVLHTPPYNLLLAEVPPAAIDPLANALYERGHTLPGVGGAREAVDRFAARWCALTGTTARPEREERLYVLSDLVLPDPMPAGAARWAGAGDRDLLIRWVVCFGADAGLGEGGGEEQFVDERLSYGGLMLWEQAGEPVSLAGASRPGAGVVRIGPVYTPPEHRRRGYGTAVTAVLTQATLDAKATGVVLYTDLANPTSNAIYQTIGFRPVEDRIVLSFGR